MSRLGLYIHIPFCIRKCNYCDFYSLASPKGDNLSNYVSMICAHMQREAHLYSKHEIDSIFIGGGTPSLINVKDFEDLMRTIRECFFITRDAEISIEANPCSLTEEKLLTYKSCGVNRLSIGMQSSSEEELRTLGRLHTPSEFALAFRLARKCGFDNINVDIMYALPEQNQADFLKTLDYVVDFEPEHISAYCLKIEDGTPFSKMELSLPNEDVQYEMYSEMCARLSCLGYEQYEISNFSKKGARCVHNLKYWHQEEYIGFGPSAHSFFDGERYFYNDNLSEYCDAIRHGELPKRIAEAEIEMSEQDRMNEYVMLAMRLCDGVSLERFKARFGVELDSVYDFKKYIDGGYIINDNNSYHFSTKGFFVSNYILSDIL